MQESDSGRTVREGGSGRDGRYRNSIRPGSAVLIVAKRDQRSGKRTEGIVREILTNSAYHPHGIKVRLQDGRVGRVQRIL
ncbi:MAG: YwbE family protein [Methanomicrobiales archaeon]|nr:YwbE family protein [Methanomicrobiales archaeon]